MNVRPNVCSTGTVRLRLLCLFQHLGTETSVQLGTIAALSHSEGLMEYCGISSANLVRMRADVTY